MFKKLFLLLTLFCFTGGLWAVPAKRTPVTLRQPDGTMLTVILTGDESFHFFQTLDGIPLVRLDNGGFEYACFRDNLLLSTGRMAHEASLRSAEETDFIGLHAAKLNELQAFHAEQAARFNAQRNTLTNAARRSPAARAVGESTTITGERKGLIILVNFQDVQMAEGHTNEVFKQMMNQENYTGNGNACSVHDYFKEQSYGKLNLTFDVVGPVTVSENLAYYGKNSGNSDAQNAVKMVVEACQLADEEVNFADYDWNGDGEVDQVFVIYAGYSEAQGGPSTSIWPHEWDLSSAGYTLRLDGVKVKTYGCTAELNGSAGSKMDGIGTACHEFSHCFGLPDMYDYGHYYFGMNVWSIMDQGVYLNNGYAPCGYTAYERMFSGWLEPVELTDRSFIENMQPLEDSPEAYIIYNDGNRNEFYVLENRQQKKTDSYLYGHGLLVTHVDYSASAWKNNTVNSSQYGTHERCTIIPADNYCSASSYDLSGDPFPGISGNTELTDESTPAATLYNNNKDGVKRMHKPITAITEQGGRISFRFMGGVDIATPTPLPVTELNTTSFTARWESVEGAERYDVEVRRTGKIDPEEQLRDSYDLTQKDLDLTEDGTTEIDNSISSYMGRSGWTGYKLFRSPGKLRMSTTFTYGWLLSPLYDVSETGYVTVRFDEQQVKTADKTVTLRIVDFYGNIQDSREVDLTNGSHTVTLEAPADSRFRVGIYPTKRMYLKTLAIYDGQFTEEDFAQDPVDDGDKPNDDPSGDGPLPNLGTEMQPSARAIGIVYSNSYTLTNLKPGGTYEWRVKAYAEGGESAWSTWQSVVLPAEETGIDQLPTLPATADTMADVYTLTGRRVARIPANRFHQTDLPAGVYLLRTSQGTWKMAK